MLQARCLECFKLMSVKSRLKIFAFLRKSKGKTNITSLVKLTALKQPTVTFHVNQLAKRGFVAKQREGRNIYCSLRRKCSPCPLFV